ncbi:SurA N-terminal domain-containing protein [Acidobacteriota bacterium]
MLKTMRKNLKSLAPTLWFVIAAFIISIFAVWGGAGRLGEGRDTNSIATVGKEKISTELYIGNLRQRIEALQRQFKELDGQFIQQLNLPQQVLEQLIQQTLLLQTADEMGLRASNAEIREKIKSYPVFQKDGKFIGFEEYKKILEWNRIAIPEFEENLKKDVLLEKVVQVLTSGVSITQTELWDNYKINNESSQLEYITLETQSMTLEEELSPDEIREFFEKNHEDYQIPERREADYIFFNSEEYKEDIELSDSEIEDYYADNTSQFIEPEKAKVSRIYLPYEDKERELIETEMKSIQDRIAGGEDFASLAKIYSKDAKAAQGGDWGLYEWQSLAEQEKESISGLSQGQVSELITLEDGLALLKVTEKSQEIQKPLELVREQIITILKDQRAREVIEEKVARLEKNARKEKSLDIAAQKLGYKIKTTGLVSEGKTFAEDIDPSGTISTSLFQLEENGLSSPLYTYKGIGLAQLRRIESPRQANLDEAEEDVKENLTAEKKKELVLEKANTLRSELQAESMDIVAERHELEVKTAEEHKRKQYLSVIGENAEVDKLAFSLPLNETSIPIEFTNGYALIRILDRKEVTKEDFQENLSSEKETQLETKKNKFFTSCMSKIREDTGVKIRYDVFLKINSDILSRFTRTTQ